MLTVVSIKQILVAVVVLNNAQLQNIPTTPVELVPAPGLGKMVVPVFTTASWNYAAGYDNLDSNSSLFFEWNAQQRYSKVANTYNGILGGSLTGNVLLMEQPTVFGGIDNQSFFVIGYNSLNGNYTGGDPSNTMTIKVYYAIVDL